MTTSNETACSEHINPDMWFPTLRPGIRHSRANLAILDEINEAKALCSDCPIRQQCLEDGMQEDDIIFGIRGGLLPAERLILSGRKKSEFNEHSIIAWTKVMPEFKLYEWWKENTKVTQ